MRVIRDLDIDLGWRGDAIAPVDRALESRGVHLGEATIRRLRSGATTPGRTAYRLACIETLRANDASLKNRLFLQIIRLGIEHRRPNREPHRPYAWRGLKEAIKGALGCAPNDLPLMVRVMRSDLAVWTTHTWDEELVARFRATAALYLRVHSRPTLRRIRTTHDEVNAAWDQQTIHGFYFALHHVAPTASRGAWLPYELDLLLRFYERQEKLGNPLTPLDRQVLAGAANHEPTMQEVANMVQAHVGIDYGHECATMHRRILATGSFAPIERRRPLPPAPSPAR